MPESTLKEIIQVQANPTPTFTHHGEAHRLWPGDELVRVEVHQLPNDDDPPLVPVTRFKGTKQESVEMAPDPSRIGMRSYRMLRANPRIRILSDGQSLETRSDIEVSAARAEVSRLAGENTDLKTEIARLNEELESKDAELAGLRADAAKAGAGAEAEAKAKAAVVEAEAKTKAEAEAKTKAEAEAKAKGNKKS